MFLVAYLLVSATIALSLYSATSRPTPKITAEVQSTFARIRHTNRAHFAAERQPNMNHINCLS